MIQWVICFFFFWSERERFVVLFWICILASSSVEKIKYACLILLNVRKPYSYKICEINLKFWFMKSFHIETIRPWRLNIISLGIIFIVMQLFFFFYFFVFKALGFKLALTHFYCEKSSLRDKYWEVSMKKMSNWLLSEVFMCWILCEHIREFISNEKMKLGSYKNMWIAVHIFGIDIHFFIQVFQISKQFVIRKFHKIAKTFEHGVVHFWNDQYSWNLNQIMMMIT